MALQTPKKTSGLGIPSDGGPAGGAAGADWHEFLAAVVPTPPGQDVLAAAMEFLRQKCAFPKPASAVGITMAELRSHGEFPTAMLVKAFIARVIKAIAAQSQARAVQDATGSAATSVTQEPPER